MADEILPFIVEKDYQAFRRIIKQDFPDAYDEWPPEYEDWLKMLEGEVKRLRLLSQTVRCIEISPDVFAKSCRDKNREGTFLNLLRCALDIAGPVDEAARANAEHHEG